MKGRPVWLASLSLRNRDGDLRCTATWRDLFPWAYKKMAKALAGRGDPQFERLFRMNVTLCLHRAATEEEVAGLSCAWQADEPAMAGGPVELIWSKGIEVSDSCRPCENPRRHVVETKRPDLWLPLDCGRCAPCLARKAIDAEIRAGQRLQGAAS